MAHDYFIDYYGPHNQMMKLKEECCELLSSIVVIETLLKQLAETYPEKSKDELFKMVFCTQEFANFFEEMADVDNLIGQFEQWEGLGKIYCLKHDKKCRQMNRIKDEIFIGKMIGIQNYLKEQYEKQV